MSKYLSILFILFTFSALGAPRIMLKFNDAKVKQGSVVDAVIGLNSETTQKLQYNQLKGQTLGETFYVYQAKPLMTKGSWDTLESEAKIIVTKIPENRPLLHKLGTDTIEIDWSEVEFIPTEVPKEFLFGTFEVPTRLELMKWALGALALGIVALISFRGYKKYKLRAEKKAKRRSLKASLSQPSTYEDVVSVWKTKPTYVKEFPHLEAHFKELERVLFKVQFKPSQTETEKAEVMKAYREFVTNSQGGFDGV